MSDRQFININNPEDTRSEHYLWNVRSHASRISRSPARASRAETESRRNKTGSSKKRSCDSATPDTPATKASEVQRPPLDVAENRASPSAEVVTYKQYSEQYRSFLPAALRYFVANFAWSIPYLNLPAQRGLDHAPWWPQPAQEPALFLGQMLSALQALNVMSAKPIMDPLDILALRGDTLRAINDLLGDNATSEAPVTLAAILHMAFHEYFNGDADTFQMHLAGLKHMIELGGVQCTVLADAYLRKAVRICLFLESSKMRQQQRAEGTPPDLLLPVDSTIAVGPQLPRLKSIKRVTALAMDSLLLFVGLASPAHCHLVQLCIPLIELAILLLDTSYSEKDFEFFSSESRFIITRMVDFGHPFQPGASNDAHSPSAQIYDVAGECMRLAMTGTLYRIMAVAELDPASTMPNLQELRNIATRLALNIEDTPYQTIATWARYVFAHSSVTSP